MTQSSVVESTGGTGANEGDNLIVGRSAGMIAACKTAAQVASTCANILLVGERGTGKELMARTIHARSPRHAGPFVALRCAGLPEPVQERELFGIGRRDADAAPMPRQGLFDRTSNGTLFIHDVDELAPIVQHSLLRLIREEEFRPIGAVDGSSVGARIVAATCRDLQAEVSAGRFRRDLYEWLQVVTIPIVPLRERREDIPLLVDYFVGRHSARMSRLPPRVGPEVYEALGRCNFPGNVRELSAMVERAVVYARMGVVTTCDLPPEVLRWTPETERAGPSPIHEDWPTLQEFQRRYVERVLAHTHGNRTYAAKLLGINRRSISRMFARERSGSSCRIRFKVQPPEAKRSGRQSSLVDS
jgi:DNA-binding NtrC family response regulator